MSHLHRLDAVTGLPSELVGSKARGLAQLIRLGLPVPPGFVIDAAACRAFLRDGRFPDGVGEALAALSPRAGVAVRSGAAVSMPGMMDTLLDVPVTQVPAAVEAVFASWHTPRAVTYRELHGIPHDLGTAVIVQEMVSGSSGVAFSRNPGTGSRELFGEILFGRPGADVVSGEHLTRPLTDLAGREPDVWAGLSQALGRLERHYRDVCHVEFTAAPDRLWFLQVRPGGLVGRAAIRVAVEMADEQLIDRDTAVRRISEPDLRAARTPRIRLDAGLDLLARGLGAGPGVATGRIAVTADRAARMAAGGPVVLVRPHTSPLDMHGLAAASGVVTSRGGPASHAAVVARSMGRPAVVAAAALTVDETAACVRSGDRVIAEGTVITIDGTGGEVALGDPGRTAGTEDPHLARLLSWRAGPPASGQPGLLGEDRGLHP